MIFQVKRTSDEFIMSNTNELVHGRASHVLRDHDRTRDTEDLAEVRLPVFISDLGQILLRVWEGAGHNVKDGRGRHTTRAGAEDFGRAETPTDESCLVPVSTRELASEPAIPEWQAD